MEGERKGRAKDESKKNKPNTDTSSEGATPTETEHTGKADMDSRNSDTSLIAHLTGSPQQPRLDLVIATDASGSMALPFSEDRVVPADSDENPVTAHEQSKIEWVSKALSEVISELGDNDRLGIVCYSNEAKTLHRLSERKSYDLEELESTILDYDVYGGTNLCNGIDKAVDVIGGQNDSDRSKQILFVSDSLPSASPTQSPFINRIREVTEREIEISFVGLDSEPTQEFSDTLDSIEGLTQHYINSSEELLRV